MASDFDGSAKIKLDLTTKIDGILSAFRRVKKEGEAAFDDIGTTATKNLGKLGRQLDKLDGYVKELTQIRDRLNEATGSLVIKDSTGKAWSTTKTDIEALNGTLDRLTTKLNTVNSTWENLASEKLAQTSTKKLEKTIQRLLTLYGEYQQILEEIETSTSIGSISDSTGKLWQKSKEGAEHLRDAMAQVEAQVETLYEELANRGVLEDTAESFEDVAEASEEVVETAKPAGTTISGLRTRLLSIYSLIVKIGGALKVLANKIKLLTNRAVKLGIRGFKTFSNVLGRWRKSSDSANKSFWRLFKTIVAAGLGIKGITALFGKLRSAISDGLKSLVAVDERTNASISELNTSLNTLKASLASAFSPIINIVAPILTYFMNLLTEVTNRIGMFLAYLTGQKAYYKATGVYQDYADSLYDEADAAKAANEATQEYLTGLDEIKKFDSGNGGGGGLPGGGGGSGSDAAGGVIWEQVEIPKSIKDFADTLKKYFKTQDWDGLGSFLASKINSVFNKAAKLLKDNKLTTKLEKIAESVAKIINALTKNIDWETIGQTFGAGLNLIIKPLKKFLQTLDTYAVGVSIATLMNGFLGEVNWTELGQTIGEYFQKLWDLFLGAAKTIKWKNIGKAIANAINGFFTTYKFSTTTKALVTFINGLFTALRAIAKTTKWNLIAKNIANGINTAITEFNWQENGESLGLFVQNLFNALKSILENIKWSEIGSGIANAIGGFFSEYKFSTTTGALVTFLNGLFDALGSFAKTLPWSDIADNIITGINTFIEDFKWEENGEKLNDFLQNLVDTMGKIITGVKWKELGEGIATLLGKVEWLKLLGTAASAIATALAEALKGLASTPEGALLGTAIATWFTVKNVMPIAEALATAFGSEAVAGTLAAALGPVLAGALIAAGVGLDAFLLKYGFEQKIENGISDIPVVDDEELATMTIEQIVAARQKAMEELETATKNLTAAENDLTVSWEYGDGQMQDYSYDMDILRARQKTLNGEIEKYDAQLQILQTREEIKTKVDIEKGTNLLKYGSPQQFIKQLDSTEVLKEKIDIKRDQNGYLKKYGSPLAFVKSWDKNKGPLKEGIDLFKTGKLKEHGSPRKYAQSLDKDKVIAEKVDVKKAGNLAKYNYPLAYVKSLDPENPKERQKIKEGVDVIKENELKAHGSPNQFAKSLDPTNIIEEKIQLKKDGWTSPQQYAADSGTEPVTVPVYLTLDELAEEQIRKRAEQAARKGWNAVIPQASGGILPFASGGIIRGIGSILSSIPHYAKGTTRPHGTMFVAGEAGPEIIGHINGQTEILNKSQIATAIYGAVSTGMASIINQFTTALFSKLSMDTNFLGHKLDMIKIPAIAMGSALPTNSAFTSAVNGGLNRNATTGFAEQDLRRIIREESGGHGANYEFVAQINRRTLFDEFIQEAKLRQMQTGKNPFEFA